MAWEHLSITKPHLVYIILGGFTSLFMLCSSVIKERLYIGEATVATICGIIFGPHAANLIDPQSWGNTDLITLEFSRIVLVVQCFAVGVELPKAYMEKHWRSVTFLLVPVMTFGWLITSIFIWWMCPKLNWLDSLCCAACVTATDPVLASSVVGKGKFAKRVPKHLRDLLSAESGCNDGMAFPFIYLALYLIRYRPDSEKVAFHWICYTILYECIFGAFYGVMVGYLARRAIRYAHEKDLIDRESFLVFYFVLALFCAGSGSLLGMDDLLVGFACGIGFSNDGWFLEKTEESHVSNVIDLLINLAFFVYFGTIIPWEQYNSEVLHLAPWRLVVIAILVIFFRRIPIMMALKPIIPDLKTWREALFAGHFGPIGVGAIFVAILARAELETEETTPLNKLPEEGFEHLNIIELIWPITTFLVMTSIVVHGSSIAVFTLGKHINTLSLTLSYTQAPDEGPSWMERLPRIQSRSKTSMSLRRPSEANSLDEKNSYPPGTLTPMGIPGNFLRRQREEDDARSSSRPTSRPTSRPGSISAVKRRSKWEQGEGPGGPVHHSAIGPQRNSDPEAANQANSGEDTLATGDDSGESGTMQRPANTEEPQGEVFQEGSQILFEDETGNVLDVTHSHEIEGDTREEKREKVKKRAKQAMEENDVQHGEAQHGEDQRPHHGEHAPTSATEANRPGRSWRELRKRMASFNRTTPHDEESADPGPASRPTMPRRDTNRGPAFAYQFGHTIIVEDESGEVIKQYDIPVADRPQRTGLQRRPTLQSKASVPGEGNNTLAKLTKVSSYFSGGRRQSEAVGGAGPSGTPDADDGAVLDKTDEQKDDDRIRFAVGSGSRRYSKAEFIQMVQGMGPQARTQAIEQAQAPDKVKKKLHRDVHEAVQKAEEESASEAASASETEQGRRRSSARRPPLISTGSSSGAGAGGASFRGRTPKSPIHEESSAEESDADEVPTHNLRKNLAQFSMDRQREHGAQNRRRLAPTSSSSHTAAAAHRSSSVSPDENSADSNEESPGPPTLMQRITAKRAEHHSKLEEGETVAERRRREAALGLTKDNDSESSDEDGNVAGGAGTASSAAKQKAAAKPDASGGTSTPTPANARIRFADTHGGQGGSPSGNNGGNNGGGGPSLRWHDLGFSKKGKEKERE